MSKIIVTSALPYVNNVPHLGNLVCVISADVYARFLKLKGKEIISVCGTDEHGTTAEVKALEEGLTPRQLVDKYFKIHKKIYEWFGCRFDYFGRTSSEANKDVTIDIFKKLDKNGFITEQILEQTYCPSCRKFLADRYVEGTCPHCGYEEARGDQCEKCGKLLNAVELIDPKCKVCGGTPEVKESTHLFIDLPKLQPKLQKWVDSVEDTWTVNARTMTKAWLKEGLRLRCITRDLEWGIKVPKKGFENKVFYSWFDAPIGYIGITAEGKKDWKKWWLDPKTTLIQFMGKDNIPFHTILFPAFLIGTGDPYTLVKELSVNEYMNYESGMFSKSRNVGVFGDDAIETEISSDVWRYYIMINRPESSDTQFVWKDFQDKNNNELLANLGNFVNRTLIFIHKYLGGSIPKASLTAEDDKFLTEVREKIDEVEQLMDKIKLKDALRAVMNISKMGNQYFQENEPWKKVKEDKARCETVLNVCANLVYALAVITEPFLPETSASILNQMNAKLKDWDHAKAFNIGSGKVEQPSVLFSNLEDKTVKEFEDKYGGEKGKEDAFSKLDLRVAKILEVKQHPEAEKLLILQIDVGTEKRQLVAGIKEYYSQEELVGKNIIIVANLKPAVLRGEKSKGMLLAAGAGKDVKLLLAEKSKPGDKVFVEGIESKPKKDLDIKEFLETKLKTKDKKIIYNNKFLKTKKEEISCDIKDDAVVK